MTNTPEKLWQRSYYDHIIRDERSLHDIREYIQNNPLKWDKVGAGSKPAPTKGLPLKDPAYPAIYFLITAMLKASFLSLTFR